MADSLRDAMALLNEPRPAVWAPTVSRFFARLRAAWLRRMTDMKCPLCGGRETYAVSDLLTFDEFGAAIVQDPELRRWLEVRGIAARGLPAPPGQVDVAAWRLPGFLRVDHAAADLPRRCSGCHSLLPTQFVREPGMGIKALNLTVIGFAEVGKTTWLNGALNGPVNDGYSIIRHTDRLTTDCYEYAEPYPMEYLRTQRGGARSNIGYVLLAADIWQDSQAVGVRTLDIMGEEFRSGGGSLARARAAIVRHLSTDTSGRAMLVVDSFAHPCGHSTAVDSGKADATRNIADVFMNVLGGFGGKLAPWPGLVWTWVDKANWTDAAGQWLARAVPDIAEPLRALARMEVPADGHVDVSSWRPFFGLEADAVTRLARAVESASGINPMPRSVDGLPVGPATEPPSAIAVEGLIRVMFRLQMLYSIRAGRSGRTKIEFFQESGRGFRDAILVLARALYFLWSAGLSVIGGGLGNLISQNPKFRVFPGGLVGGHEENFVWADLVLLETLEQAGGFRAFRRR